MGMKTAISVPDDLFKLGETFAKRTARSRSGLYSEALREYLARHEPVRIARGWEGSAADFDTPEWRAWIQQGYESWRTLEW